MKKTRIHADKNHVADSRRYFRVCQRGFLFRRESAGYLKCR